MTHLDTSFVIDLLREGSKGVHGAAHAMAEHLRDEPLAISVFVACELEVGARRATHPQRERARVAEVLASVSMVFPDERFAPTYAELLHSMLSSGHSVPVIDLLIATTAVVDGVPLVTRNPRHFQVVPRLDVQSY